MVDTQGLPSNPRAVHAPAEGFSMWTTRPQGVELPYDDPASFPFCLVSSTLTFIVKSIPRSIGCWGERQVYLLGGGAHGAAYAGVNADRAWTSSSS